MYGSAIIVEHINRAGEVLDIAYTTSAIEAEYYFCQFYAKRYVECNGALGDGMALIHSGWVIVAYPDLSRLMMRYDPQLVELPMPNGE